ncbi:cysteine proteinase, partial [Piedraia hortae CBS 480.64]
VDIFKTPYIVVPICVRLHWFVAIICNLDTLMEGGEKCEEEATEEKPVEVRLLKEYVAKEGEEKRGMQIDRSVFQGMRALGIPEQTNFCDCGVYLIGYVEQFVKDPQRFVAQVAGRRLEGHVDFADFSPSEKRADLRNTLLKLQSEQ